MAKQPAKSTSTTEQTDTVTVGAPTVTSSSTSAAPMPSGPPIDFKARQDKIGIVRRKGGKDLTKSVAPTTKPADAPPSDVED